MKSLLKRTIKVTLPLWLEMCLMYYLSAAPPSLLHTHTHTPLTHTDLAPSLTASPLHSSVGVSSRHELYHPPSSDNPVAQTLYKMLEPEDRVC